ncbi:MAG: tryptophan 2,3-dioxygenase family protein, partial [Planctomycetota bacterium]
MALDYRSYLKLDQLLNLQEPRSDPAEHDETLFIVIHQVYELWFKLLLHELGKIKRDFSDDRLYGAVATFKRARMVMKTLVGQLDILETITPMSFASFRDLLETASGFQSVQFRELEFMLGYRRAETLEHHDQSSPGYAQLARRLQERSLIDHFYDFLEQHGCAIPDHLRGKDIAAPTLPDTEVQ